MGFLLSQKSKTGNNVTFILRGVRVCRTTFLFCYAVSKKLYSALCKHFVENGPVRRVHGNTKRQPHNAFSLESKQMAINFIENFAIANAVTLPGRVANYRDEDAKLLLIPSFETKESIYDKYKVLCLENNYDSVGSSLFGELWKSQLPNVVISKPMGDLCWVCQQGNERLLRSHVENDDDQDELNEAHRAHIIESTQEARVMFNEFG